MSAFGGKADIARSCPNVCFCPQADIGGAMGDYFRHVVLHTWGSS
jgi:hypothetical protein